MTDRYRDLCRQVDTDTRALGDAMKSVEKALDRVVPEAALLANKPTPVVEGVELPQTIVFTEHPDR